MVNYRAVRLYVVNEGQQDRSQANRPMVLDFNIGPMLDGFYCEFVFHYTSPHT